MRIKLRKRHLRQASIVTLVLVAAVFALINLIPGHSNKDLILANLDSGDNDSASKELLDAISTVSCFGFRSDSLTEDFVDIGNAFESRKYYPEALESYIAAVRLAESNSSKHQIQLAKGLWGQGNCFYMSSRYQEACEAYKSSLSIYETMASPGKPRAQLLQCLANSYAASGSYPDAIICYRKALTMIERTYGEHNPLVADLLLSYADCYHHNKQYLQAEPIYKHALALIQECDQHDCYKLINCLLSQAVNYDSLENQNLVAQTANQAMTLIAHALATKKDADKRFGQAAANLEELGIEYFENKQYSQAAPFFETAMKLRLHDQEPNQVACNEQRLLVIKSYTKG